MRSRRAPIGTGETREKTWPYAPRTSGRIETGGAIAVLLLVSAGCLPAGAAGTAAPTTRPEPAAYRVHRDAAEVERSFLAALEALLSEDPARAKDALDRVSTASPPVVAEAHRDLGTTVVDADRAFQKLLLLAREEANHGDDAQAFRYHQALQRTCLQCHQYARKDGVAVGAAPSAPSE
jgi:hypothetical protein